jgi:hypothetical protein
MRRTVGLTRVLSGDHRRELLESRYGTVGAERARHVPSVGNEGKAARRKLPKSTKSAAQVPSERSSKCPPKPAPLAKPGAPVLRYQEQRHCPLHTTDPETAAKYNLKLPYRARKGKRGETDKGGDNDCNDDNKVRISRSDHRRIRGRGPWPFLRILDS